MSKFKMYFLNAKSTFSRSKNPFCQNVGPKVHLKFPDISVRTFGNDMGEGFLDRSCGKDVAQGHLERT
jgi:hypothetical protein